ncbi:unnamed protein product [Kuraishia capsulata CBS 1993]|uniref:Major facilitator superfamily (MFS) profile domain-containing protein n=1 Tax=Kuraishia capsulata CBS 1993 TaxID=1382522 RepID=W6MPF6_9ASCO|nr:uncharacterized protein KUCA_T00004494001 [Kuraishia capsulata CBS 1993]CDK28511.1 unnamed protein product [Kuraishia capsulata CBS 1993]
MAELQTKTSLEHIETNISSKSRGDEYIEEARAMGLPDFHLKDEEWHAEMHKKLLWKIDTRMLPLLILMYLLNFLDRSNLSQAKLGTYVEDLKLKGNDFNTITSVLFAGYILMQLPSNLLLTRVRPSLYICACVTLWGVVSTCQAAVHSKGAAIACRFFLGVVEAPFFPGVMMIMSSWYKREELGHRYALFYAGSALANMFGGLIGAGVLNNLNGTHGIAAWRWLFIIEGVATIGVAIISSLFLPDYPKTTKWLTQEERDYAQWRLVKDIGKGDEGDSVTIKQAVIMAFKDYRMYLFIVAQHCNLLAQSFTYFFPSIVKTLGFGTTETLLLTVPVWFATFLSALIVSYHSSRTNERCYHIAISMLVAMIGNIISVSTTKTGPRFFAMFLMPMGALPAFQLILTWVANSFPRPLAKRSACIATVNMLGNIASIYGSYMYPDSQKPRYEVGGSITAAVCLVCAIMAIVIRFVLKHENRKLELHEQEVLEGEDPHGVDEKVWGFRYIL